MISPFSFVSSLIWSTVLILLAYFCCRWRKFIQCFGLASTSFLTCAALRLLLPLEFPKTIEVTVAPVFNPINDVLRYELSFGEEKLAIQTLLIFIWSIVAAIILIATIKINYLLLKNAKAFPKMILSEALLKRIFINTNYSCLHIAKGSANIGPYVTGLIHPVIVVPDIRYKDCDLENVITHEYYHFKLGHLWLRLFLGIICSIFWWNPAMYLLKRELYMSLECDCDRAVLKHKNSREAIVYADTLLYFAGRHFTPTTPGAISFSAEQGIKNRFWLILHKPKNNKGSICFTLLCGLFFFVCSYTVVLQPYYEPPESTAAPYITEEQIYNANITKINSDNYLLTIGSQTFIISQEETQIFLKTKE